MTSMRNPSSYKPRANALFITIAIALVIGTLCSLMIFAAYNKHRIDRSIDLENRLQRNLQSALEWTLADTSLALVSQDSAMDLFGEGNDSCYLKRESWGLYSVRNIRVVTDGKSKTRIGFFGQIVDSPLDGSLYLAEHKSPLSLVGFARLIGDAYLPKGQVRPAYIDERGYAFPELIKGNIKYSQDSLPALDRRLVDWITQWEPANVQSIIPDVLYQSFGDSIVTLYGKETIELSTCDFKGHILIRSDSIIRVKADAKLENVILLAPFIEFENGFSGKVQAIARDSIIVKKNCKLLYPSALVLAKQPSSQVQPMIIIGDSCIMEGVALTILPRGNDLKRTYMELGKGSTLTGYAYVSGFLFLKGAVHGVVLADYLVYKSLPSIYTNYLVDASIDRNALSAYFVGPGIFIDHKQNRIVQWVN